jgi:hypothetical protein
VVTRYEFLEQLHDKLKPSVYLEIGVQSGASLRLAKHAEVAIGVDPKPAISEAGLPPNAMLYESTSDEFFSLTPPAMEIDLAFIDGMHLWEFALRDFMNIELAASSEGLVVFDDVLPYNRDIASRVQPEGDWTGDVWKIWPILLDWRTDLDIRLVDVQPTGLMLVRNLNRVNRVLWKNWKWINEQWAGREVAVPYNILDRTVAISPSVAIDWIMEPQ